MVGVYDDCDGKIWMDGKLVEWCDVNVYILIYGLYYVSLVFEGECCYSGKIFKGYEYLLCLIEFVCLLDM